MTHIPLSPATRAGRQRGVGLIEVLVALVIFAFGMLGLAGLQTRSLAFSQTSLYRSQAAALTDDILDRMRADRANAKLGNWNSDFSVRSADITGTALSAVDVRDWKQELENLLPAGAARIDVAVGGVVTVTVQWDEQRVRGSNAQQFVTVSQL